MEQARNKEDFIDGVFGANRFDAPTDDLLREWNEIDNLAKAEAKQIPVQEAPTALPVKETAIAAQAAPSSSCPSLPHKPPNSSLLLSLHHERPR